MKKLFVSISIAFVAMVVASVGVLEVCAASGSRPVMDSDNACLFIGFITNDGTLTKDEIMNSDAYKLLTNSYEGEDEEVKLCALNLYIKMSTAQMANKAEENKTHYCNEIISYLKKQLPESNTDNIAEEIINEQKNECLDILVEGFDDVISGICKNSKSVFKLDILYGIYSGITDTYDKAEKIVDYTMIALNSLGFVFESEYAGRYGYFLSYLSNRPTWESADDELFRFIMENNQTAYAVNNWASSFLDLFTFITNKDSFSNHYDVIDYWAEFTFLLGEYLDDGNADVSDDMYEWPTGFETYPLDEKVSVDSVRFKVDEHVMFIGWKVDIPARTFPKNAYHGRNIKGFTSSDDSIVSVDPVTGEITSVSYGTAYVYAESNNGIVGKCKITVLPYYASKSSGEYTITQYVGNDTEIEVPNEVEGVPITAIGTTAFQWNKTLESVTLPEGVKSIGSLAFDGCKKLKYLYIPSTVTKLFGMSYWDSLEQIEVSENNSYYYSIDGVLFDNKNELIFYPRKKKDSIYVVPLGTKTIGENVFQNNDTIERVVISSTVKRIECQAFDSCKSLVEVSVEYGLEYIDSYAFFVCEKLKEVDLPSSVKTIGGAAFEKCISLQTVNLSEGLEIIEGGAFYDCSSLSDINLPSSLTELGAGAFYGCVNLRRVEIPKGVSTIAYGTFDGCCKLEYIVIPETVISIEDYAFFDVYATIYGYSNSEAQAFADRLGYRFKDLGLCKPSYDDCQSDAFSKRTIDFVDLYGWTEQGDVYMYSWYYDENNNQIAKSDWPGEKMSLVKKNTDYGIGVYTLEIPSDMKYVIFSNEEGWLYSDAVRLDYFDSDTIFRCTNICGESQKVEAYIPEFSGATLTLQSNITINFKASDSQFWEGLFTNPYVVFETDNGTYTVTDYTISNGSYVFDFKNISPACMGDIVSATLYACFDGVEYSSETKEYSVKMYCYNMLSKYDVGYPKIKTLLIDLLNYGAQAQIYENYNIHDLVNSDLTNEQRMSGTQGVITYNTVQDLTFGTIDNPTVIWKSGGLNLTNSVEMRFKFVAEEYDNLVVKIETENCVWSIASDKFEKVSDGYYLFFDGLDASQMRESVYFTIYDGDVPVSNTICYSIESYAYAKQYDVNDRLVNLLEAMMKYGDSAKIYADYYQK